MSAREAARRSSLRRSGVLPELAPATLAEQPGIELERTPSVESTPSVSDSPESFSSVRVDFTGEL